MTSAAWFDVTALNATRSREFYGELLDCEVTVLEAWDYGLVRPASDRIAGGIGQAREGGEHPPGVVLYFAVSDLVDALGRVERMGGGVVVPAWALEGYGRMAVVVDPDGNRVGLWQRPDEPDEVIVAGYVRMAPQRRAAYVEAMAGFVRRTRERPECIDLVITVDSAEQDRVNIFERWESEAALDAFRAIANPPSIDVEFLEERVSKHVIATTGPAFG